LSSNSAGGEGSGSDISHRPDRDPDLDLALCKIYTNLNKTNLLSIMHLIRLLQDLEPDPAHDARFGCICNTLHQYQTMAKHFLIAGWFEFLSVSAWSRVEPHPYGPSRPPLQYRNNILGGLVCQIHLYRNKIN
jgi:hypothetical protein